MAAESFAGIEVPEGDPGAVRDAAGTFDAVSGGLEGAAAEVRSMPGVLSAWQGPASVSYGGSCMTNGSAIDAGVQALDSCARAARVYAGELEEAQREARAAIEEARDAQRRIDRAEQEIEAARSQAASASGRLDAANERIAISGLTGAPDAGAQSDAVQAGDDLASAQERESRARRELEQARDDLEAAQRRGERAEEAARDAARTATGAFQAVAGSSPAAAIFGPSGMAAAGGAAAPGENPFLAVGQAGKNAPFLYGTGKYVYRWLLASPGARSWFGLTPQLTPYMSTFNNGYAGGMLAKGLQQVPATSRAGQWLANSSKATPWFRGLGVAGGAFGTVTGGYDLIQQGNPVEAFKRDPAAYSSDLAGTAFSASSTAFMVAPNPVTGGAVIVTGIAWAGTEIWQHHEEIGQAIEDGAEWTADKVGEGADWAWDHSVPGAVWNNREEIGQAIEDGRQFAEDTVEQVGQTLDEGVDMASDVGEEVLDTGEDLLEDAGDVIDDIPTPW